MKRYTEEKERLERKKEEIRGHLAQLRRDKRELKEMLLRCTGRGSGLRARVELGSRHMGFEREGPGFVHLTSGSLRVTSLLERPLVLSEAVSAQIPGHGPQHQQVVRLFPGWI